MRLIVTWLTVVVFVLVAGASGPFAAPSGESKAPEKKPSVERVDATTRHIMDLKSSDPKIRASAAKDLGCS